jgi:RNA polymerase sigma-70 factor (ECF subfamily)
VTFRQAALALRRRRHVAWESLDSDEADAVLPPSPDIAGRVVEMDALRTALRTLGPADAACFLLQAVQGFTTGEIAEIVGLRPTAVRKRLSRARQRLRAAYSAIAGETGAPARGSGAER